MIIITFLSNIFYLNHFENYNENLNSISIINKNYCQHGFGKSGALVINLSIILLMSFGAILNICASIAPPSQSPKTLAVIVSNDKDKFEVKKLKN